MTKIRVDAATLERIRSAGGGFLMCDEAGNPVHLAEMYKEPFDLPRLSDEEWAACISEPGGMTTAQALAYLQTLDPS